MVYVIDGIQVQSKTKCNYHEYVCRMNYSDRLCRLRLILSMFIMKVVNLETLFGRILKNYWIMGMD